MRRWWRRRRARRWVHPHRNEIAKFFPHNPPMKGDTVLVDGVRCRVIRSCLEWEGLTWTLVEPGVLVVPDPLPPRD